ncbi:MAG: hypothetical protein LKM32_08710 [Chiayiivirga sp.]|jgi:hypothetical protein|uniref:hypothetical protein n=1 Tax=Chiayiivirga sp. TaxID=2041042 RepID=UPI0025B8093F|nr:hypothetical protein [Chiayiivirga sp.]MCI1711969.1 hypothetical protein [Chiayiivirga sp.]MCI1729434.1 hypothetical protein [Chiayiivirga sp.]
MILRRLAQQLREQNWAAIFIEFVLLVLGVFLGIQVANWNASLAEERIGRAYAARLHADLEQDLTSLRELVTYYGAVLDSVVRTDVLLADPQSDAMDLVVSAYRASEINFNPMARATWDEVVSSGDIGLLPPRVAREAAEHYAFDTSRDTYEILIRSAYRNRVRKVIPLGVQQAMRAGCSDHRDDAQKITGFMPGCSLDLAPETIAATAAALRADPAVQANLRYQYSDVFSAHANIRGDVASTEQALAALDAQPALPENTP